VGDAKITAIETNTKKKKKEEWLKITTRRLINLK
jgi:hypothetical protein